MRLGALLLTTILAGGGAALAQTPPPAFLVPGTVSGVGYDGVVDDLATGGLGRTGLGAATLPAIANPNAPTAAELRRRAIHANYRAIVDPVAAGGYGVLWGPNVTTTYTDSGTEGLVAGGEYIAYADDGAGAGFVTLVVQVPNNFDMARRCVLLAPSSGSRGVYGGISVGEWGLKQGCAVAYTDKGTGNGFHDLTRNRAYDQRGLQGDAAALGSGASFQAQRTQGYAAWVAANPERWATKHAHGRGNPEALWGRHVLMSAEFAIWVLNERFRTTSFTPATTRVIASGVSNGGAASLLAAEQDVAGLIDAVVVSEPNINPTKGAFNIVYGGAAFADHSRPLYDLITLLSLYAPCASLAPALAGTPFQTLEPSTSPALTAAARANRCTALAERGLVGGATTDARATAALAVIHGAGILPESNTLFAAHEFLSLWRSLSVTYAGAYGQFGVEDNLCGISFAATDAAGRPTTLATASALSLFGAGSGIPSTGGLNLVADRAANGPILENLAISTTTGRQDLNLDGALCYRKLWDPSLAGAPTSLIGGFRGQLNGLRVRDGVRRILASGNLGGRPTIIAHGRSDGLIAPNHTSRAYLGLNAQVEGSRARLSYWEIANGQHFDAFLSGLFLVNGASQHVPMHYYLTQGLDRMLAHLTTGAALPPSQVIRATPRGTQAITAANFASLLPAPAADPGANRVTAGGGQVVIPR